MDEQYMSMILLFGFDYAPKTWMQCNGALLPILQNQALFALLGVQYGGNGTQTFALPDLRGRVGIGFGNSYVQAAVGGTESFTLNTTQLPSHIDQIPSTSAAGTVASPLNARLASGPKTASGPNATFLNTYAPSGTLPAVSLYSAGTTNPLPISLMQPYTVLNYCIATSGIYPSRN